MAEQFLALLASLASDPVPGIRIVAARHIQQLPSWAQEFPKIEQAVTILCEDAIVSRAVGNIWSREDNKSPPLPPPPPSSLAPPSAEASERKKEALSASSSPSAVE